MKRRVLLALAVVLCCSMSSIVLADDESQAKIIASIKKLAERDQVSLTGSVEQEKAGDEVFGGGGVLMSTVIGGDGTPYEGEVAVLKTKDGETVLVSKGAIPGVAIYSDGVNEIKQKTVQGEDFSVDKLANALPQLTDWNRLVKVIEESADVRTVERDGKTQVICQLGESFIEKKKPRGGGIGAVIKTNLGAEKVLETTATFMLDGDNITGVTYAVQYSDPMKEMLRNGTLHIGGLPGAGPAEDDEAEDDEGPALGAQTVIKLNVTDDVAPRAEAFRKFVADSIES